MVGLRLVFPGPVERPAGHPLVDSLYPGGPAGIADPTRSPQVELILT